MNTTEASRTAQSAVKMAPGGAIGSQGKCEYCSGPFIIKKPNQRFCMTKCQQAAHWERTVREAAVDLLAEALDVVQAKRAQEQIT